MSANSENNHAHEYMRMKLMPHRGHAISCVSYGDFNDPADVSIECEHCGEVLVSAEVFDSDPDDELNRLRTELALTQMQLKDAHECLQKAVECMKGVPQCLLDTAKCREINTYLAKAENYEAPAHIHPSEAKRGDRLPLPKVVVFVERGTASVYSNIPGLDAAILDMDTTDPDERDELDAAAEEFWAEVHCGNLKEEC